MNKGKEWLKILIHRGFGSKKWKRGFAGFGENSHMDYPAVLSGNDRTHIGKNVTILKNARIQNYTDKVPDMDGIYIEDDCYIGFGVSLLNAGKIRIGKGTIIAANVLISSENHGMNPEDPVSYADQALTAKDVSVGEGCWLAQNVCILAGVTVGDKSVIGAGSIVTKDIPPYCIAAGNPARVIKTYNFDTHQWERV